jgi:hypothetical protein
MIKNSTFSRVALVVYLFGLFTVTSSMLSSCKKQQPSAEADLTATTPEAKVKTMSAGVPIGSGGY